MLQRWEASAPRAWSEGNLRCSGSSIGRSRRLRLDTGRGTPAAAQLISEGTVVSDGRVGIILSLLQIHL